MLLSESTACYHRLIYYGRSNGSLDVDSYPCPEAILVPRGYIIKILICVGIPPKITPESTKTLYCPPMQFANMLPNSLLWPAGGGFYSLIRTAKFINLITIKGL